tara:strand:- start:10 stop:480 length:471 start_codon:yes stop_codon:yes gene_type:complete
MKVINNNGERIMTNKKESIYNKLYKVQREIGAISKDSTNPFYKSKYFDINSLIKQVTPILEKHKLLLLQPIKDGEQYSIIFDLDGGSVESSLKLPTDLDAQKIGSAITYYRRYTLQSLLGLQAEDDDGNVASGKHNYKKGTNEGNISSFESDGFGV